MCIVMEGADFFGRGWKESYHEQGHLTTEKENIKKGTKMKADLKV